MFSRLLAGGVTWLAVVILFVAGARWSGPARVPPPDAGAGVESTLDPTRSAGDTRWGRWKVAKTTTVNHVMVVDVEAERVNEAISIAPQVIQDVRADGYDEVLIYVRTAGTGTGPAERRVQWTPRGGYVEMVLVP